MAHNLRQYRKFCAKGKQLPRYNQIYGWNIRLRNTFLDTKVYKGERFNRESTLDVQTHYKQTETFQHTNFYSCHPPGVKKGFIKGEAQIRQSWRLIIKLTEWSVMWSARFLPHMNHVSVSPTNGDGPTQGQRKTLTGVGIEPTTFGLDLRRSTDWVTRSDGSRPWKLKMLKSRQWTCTSTRKDYVYTNVGRVALIF